MDTTVNDVWNSAQICNVAAALSSQASLQPGVTAIHYPSGHLLSRKKYSNCTYAELDNLCNSYARGLETYGIGPGVRTALMLPPGLDFLAVFYALFKCGAIPVLIDPAIGKERLKQCIEEAAPQAFIGSARAQLARRLYGWVGDSCKLLVTAGRWATFGGVTLKQIQHMGGLTSEQIMHRPEPSDMAAILFTSGSTGAPKGVVYRHRHFVAQVELLSSVFNISAGEISMQTFPPFALFDTALGMTTVIPDMDPSRPAKADPERLIAAIEKFEVNSLFCSPALLDLLGRYCEVKGKRLKSINRVMSAGAAVPIQIIRRLEKAVYDDAVIHTPYGATECLPVSNVTNRELNESVQDQMESGEGICVGKPVEANSVLIIKISDIAIDHLDDATQMPPGMPGEILVSGPSCTDAYWQQDAETRMANVQADDGTIWHRMGDAGVLDGSGRLWFLGRISQRIETDSGVLFAEQCEAVFNQHPDLARSAVVGVGAKGRQTPVLCIEVSGKLEPVDVERVHYDLLQLAQAFSLTRQIQTVLFHDGLPVDVRHNSKIDRANLAAWATAKMQR